MSKKDAIPSSHLPSAYCVAPIGTKSRRVRPATTAQREVATSREFPIGVKSGLVAHRARSEDRSGRSQCAADVAPIDVLTNLADDRNRPVTCDFAPLRAYRQFS